MNLILCEPPELTVPLPRNDPRAEHILKVLRRQIGDTFDVGLTSKFGATENNLLIGAEANKIRFVHSNDGFPGTTVTLPVFGFQPGLYDERGVFRARYRTNTTTAGLFVEDQLKLTSQFSVVAVSLKKQTQARNRH